MIGTTEKAEEWATDSVTPRKSVSQVYPKDSNQDSEGPRNQDVWEMVESAFSFYRHRVNMILLT